MFVGKVGVDFQWEGRGWRLFGRSGLTFDGSLFGRSGLTYPHTLTVKMIAEGCALVICTL